MCWSLLVNVCRSVCVFGFFLHSALDKAGVLTFICFQAYLSTANVFCLFVSAATANVLMCISVCVRVCGA